MKPSDPEFSWALEAKSPFDSFWSHRATYESEEEALTASRNWIESLKKTWHQGTEARVVRVRREIIFEASSKSEITKNFKLCS